MNFLLLANEAAAEPQGWLTRKLLQVTLTSAEWVLWLLAILSVVSVAIMLERLVYFLTHRLPNSEDIGLKLSLGQFDEVRKLVADAKCIEASVVKEGLEAAPNGPDVVQEVISRAIARERPAYERFLVVLGTSGSSAPFVGLFGTVLGIIKAFHDLGRVNLKGSQAIQQTVMVGISEALVATAVGLAVAIPAVVAYNLFVRWLKNMTARTNALGHALVGHLRAAESRQTKQGLREVK